MINQLVRLNSVQVSRNMPSQHNSSGRERVKNLPAPGREGFPIGEE
jgi:hypothetical protein